MNVPSGYTALDLIGFTDKGDYDSSVNYVKNDLAHDNGRVWLCLIDDTIGIAPAVGVANWKIWIDEAAYLSGLADTTITNPADGQVLRYDSATSKWVNAGVDSTPTQSSTNLVQSGGVYTQLASKADTADLATVATTGAYSDLSGTPQLAAVATSGQYSDLSGTPTIPTVNDATLTIQKNGTNVETFTANSSTNKTANITVPTKTSDLTNDSDFVVDANYSHITVDSSLSTSSNNPIENQAITNAHNSLKNAFTNQVNSNGSKNVLQNDAYSQTISGVTFTVNSDKSITANGTATANIYYTLSAGVTYPKGEYKKSGCPSGGSSSTYFFAGSGFADYGNGVDVTLANDTSLDNVIVIKNGTAINKTFYPMLCLKSDYDLDPTYAPPAKTNRQLTEDTIGLSQNINHNGCKNLLNFEGTLSIATTDTATKIVGYVSLKQGDVITYSCKQNNAMASNTRNTLDVQKQSTSGGQIYEDVTTNYHLDAGIHKMTFTVPSDGTYFFRFWGHTLSTDTTYSDFMVCYAEDYERDPSYVPYAMTNKELTDNKINASEIAPIENGTTASTNYAQGAYFIHNGKFCKAKTAIASGASFTLNTNYEVTTVAAELIALNS